MKSYVCLSHQQFLSACSAKFCTRYCSESIQIRCVWPLRLPLLVAYYRNTIIEVPVKNQDNTEEKPIYFPWERLWKTSWSQWYLSWVLRGHTKQGYSKAWCELKNQTYERFMFQEQRAVCCTWMRTAGGGRESLCFEFQFSTSSRLPI